MLGKKRLFLFSRFGYKKSKLYWVVGVFSITMLLLFLLVAVIKYTGEDAVPVSSTDNHQLYTNSFLKEVAKIMVLLDISEARMKQIISEGCPVVASQGEEINSRMNLLGVVASGLGYITDLDTNDPTAILKSQMAALAAVNFQAAQPVYDSQTNIDEEEDFYLETPPGLEEWHFELDPTKPVELTKDPLVLLYTTHNAETYKPTDGKSKLEGKNAGVAKAAKALQDTLESKHGLKTIRSEVIHDYPDWTRSYINSLKTAQSLLKANKTILAVFDVHRDAGFKDKATTTIEINGKKSASIMIVVGTEHERWRQNLAFAQKLEKKANETYPKLIRDIRIANNRRYNQQLHPNALIIEVGSDLNTLEEAQYGASLFAEIAGQVLKEMVN
ncbi:MAG: stage II sporulation protein P [Bacillota bacterium]